MKKNKNTMPLKINLELNERAGIGFQIHVVMENDIGGYYDHINDKRALSYGVASAVALTLVELFNEQTGHNIDPDDVISHDEEALLFNVPYDPYSKIISLINGRKQEKYEATYDQCCIYYEIDGEKNDIITGYGMMVAICIAWKDNNDLDAHEAMARYCERLSMHGYDHNASSIFAKIDSLDSRTALIWLDETYKKYILDDLSDILYVLGDCLDNPDNLFSRLFSKASSEEPESLETQEET